MLNKISVFLACCCQNFLTCCLVGLICAWKKKWVHIKRDSTLLLSCVFLILYLFSISKVKAVFRVAPGWVSAMLAAHRPCSVECKDMLDTLFSLEPSLWQGDIELLPSGMSPQMPLRDFLTQRASLYNLRKPGFPVHLPTETFLVKRELVLDFLDYFPSPNSHQFHAWASNSLL